MRCGMATTTPCFCNGSECSCYRCVRLLGDLRRTVGEEPAWKRKWKFDDYIMDGVQRAGLLGIAQFESTPVNGVSTICSDLSQVR